MAEERPSNRASVIASSGSASIKVVGIPALDVAAASGMPTRPPPTIAISGGELRSAMRAPCPACISPVQPQNGRMAVGLNFKTDWNHAAGDYAKHRAGFPDWFFDRVEAASLFRRGQRVLDLATGT